MNKRIPLQFDQTLIRPTTESPAILLSISSSHTHEEAAAPKRALRTAQAETGKTPDFQYQNCTT